MNVNWLRYLAPVSESVLAGIIGMLVGAAIMLLYGYDPVAAYVSLFKGSFGEAYSWAESLANATPLILTALTFAVGMRGGLFNIGAEGQVYLGALAAVAVSWFSLPPGLHALVALGAAALVGVLWSVPAALLKLTRGVHEVISTIMFNWIAHFLAFYLIANVLVDPRRAEKTISIAPSSRLPLLMPGASVSVGLFVAVVLAVFVLFLLWRTTLGFELRALGFNPEASHYAGISRWKAVVLAFVVGGITAGLAGAVQVMGRPPTYAVFSGLPQFVNLGFDGIGVAMIGRNHPIGILFSAVFFGGLLVGGRIMQFSPGVPLEMVRVVEGVIILSLAVPELKRLFTVWRRKKTPSPQREQAS